MKNIFAAKRFAFVLASVVLLMSFRPAADRANFSGDWKLNAGKSELGEFGARFAATSMKVDQSADAITIARTSPGFNGGDPVTNTITLTFDGKVVESTGFNNSKRKSTASWTNDQTLTINTTTTMERNGQTNEFKGTETWTLTNGSLSIVNVSSSPRGENTIKAVYDK